MAVSDLQVSLPAPLEGTASGLLLQKLLHMQLWRQAEHPKLQNLRAELSRGWTVVLLGRTRGRTVGFQRWWDAERLAGRQSTSLYPHFPQFRPPADCRCLFTSSRLWGPFQTNSIRLPASLQSLTALLLWHLRRFFGVFFFSFCLCNIYDAISHTPLHCSHHEGSTGKCWCHNFLIINKMMSNGTVPSWRKHGTVQPSRLHHPLASLTTGPMNVTQASESTFRHMQHFALVLAAFFFPF